MTLHYIGYVPAIVMLMARGWGWHRTEKWAERAMSQISARIDAHMTVYVNETGVMPAWWTPPVP